jgi:hypothetical protein
LEKPEEKEDLPKKKIFVQEPSLTLFFVAASNTRYEQNCKLGFLGLSAFLFFDPRYMPIS